MNQPTKCPKYETCNAMLCPLNKDIGKRYWYPVEDICGLKKFWTLRWVGNQKKIKKKAPDVWRYYLYKMLNRKFVITGAITGLAPDKDEKPQLRAWLKAHPELKQPSRRKLEAIKKARQKSPL